MTIDNKVKEKDIFNYIFNRTSLPAEIIDKIERDPEFKNRIEYYKEMKNSLDSIEPDDAEICRIASGIDAFKPAKHSAESFLDSLGSVQQSSAES